MAVQHNVMRGICAGLRSSFWASHSDARASASWMDGRVSGNPRGVRKGRPSRVIVCHSFGVLPWGFNREDQDDVSLIDVCTPLADWVPSTPADIGEATDSVSLEEPFTIGVFAVGGAMAAMPTFL